MWLYWIIGYMLLTIAGVIWLLASIKKAPSDIDLFGCLIEEIEAKIAGDTEAFAQIHALRGRMTELALLLPHDTTVSAYAYKQPAADEVNMED